MANSYDMTHRTSTPVTISVTVAFIAISGLCAAQPVFTLDGANRSLLPQQATPGLKPEQVPCDR
jgi:hypothetical protein